MNLASFQMWLLGWLPEPQDDESGQGLVEYAFILVMIALFVLVTLIIVGNQTQNLWSDIIVPVGRL